MKHDFRPLRPLIVAAALCLAGAPALAQQSSSPDTIATSGQDRAANAGAAAAHADAAPAATASAAPGTAAAATPEQQAALAGARPANAPAPSNVLATQAPSAAGSLVQTILSLGFVIALLVGLAWLLKRFGPKHITGGTTVKLVGALSVGARERILVVEVGEQWIVVGASPGRMNALATMPRQEIDESTLANAQPVPGANFAEWFKQTIEKRNGK
ncbi:flagellar biosynthetic protein FliO [Pseudoduganella eburnea]|uniref:Flagellar protein n=1 Tax=Massilia eburnea TaxID=1776165 RepID=A0A6L6QFM5_9BURK|nr:flagellar biosynthetic protein FliO [Massilia eburnea]MTW11055.1 flagellar biosynthetic protein FliO [Massilia eburnea]